MASRLWQCFLTALPPSKQQTWLNATRKDLEPNQFHLSLDPWLARSMTRNLPKQSYLPRVIVDIIAAYGTTDRYEVFLSLLEKPLEISTLIKHDCDGPHYVSINIYRGISEETNSVVFISGISGTWTYPLKTVFQFLKGEAHLYLETLVHANVRSEWNQRLDRLWLRMNTF